MDHECALFFAVGPRVREVETIRHAEIILHGERGIFLTVCINWLSDPKLFPLEATLAQTVSLFIEGAGLGSRKSKMKIGGEDSAQGKLL